mgnify:CR=1 FL=1
MTKTKSQLRAEAVERLRNATFEDCDNIPRVILGDDYPNWVNYDTVTFRKTIAGRIADLLTDDEPDYGDEPFCETVRRWLETDAPEECRTCDDGCWRKLSEELAEGPGEVRAGSSSLEGDIARELRQYANDVRYDYNALDDVYEPDEHLGELCARAADVIERGCVAERMDGDGTGDGTRPNESRTFADMSEKDAESVRNDGFASEIGASDAVDRSNDGNGNSGTAEAETSQVPEFDTREKLEADVRRFVYENGWFDCDAQEVDPGLDSRPTILDLFVGWLNRQAAITRTDMTNPDGLPVGLTVSDDGSLLNWRGENYVRREDYVALGKSLGLAQAERDGYREDMLAQTRRVAELTAERDELVKQRNRAESDAKTQRNNFDQATGAREHWKRKAEEAERERDEWKAKAESRTFADMSENDGESVRDDGFASENGVSGAGAGSNDVDMDALALWRRRARQAEG